MFTPYFFTRFPIWQFLNQPIFTSTSSTILIPSRFWRRYQLELLERCLKIDYASGDACRD